MAILRWFGAAALVGSVGCGSSSANAPDGSAGGDDGSAAGDASLIDSVANADALVGAGPSDVESDAITNSDANVGDAGSADGACVTGSVTFRMLVAPTSLAGFCFYFSDPGTATWIGVRPAEGAGIAIADPCPTVSACDSCFCNGGAGYDFLGDGGPETTWYGTYYVSDAGVCGRCGMCGQCFTQGCAPPGTYVATFCAYPQASDGGCDTSKTVCVDTPFVWPPADGSAPVLGVVGP